MSAKFPRGGAGPFLARSLYGVRSYCLTVAKMWNSLPQEFQGNTSTEHFRSQISTWSEGLYMLIRFLLLTFMFGFLLSLFLLIGSAVAQW